MRLLDAEHVLGPFPYELSARACQCPQVEDRRGRYEARSDETMRQQVGDPGGIVDVCLPAGHVLDVHGVGQHQLERPVEHMPDRLPVDPRRLHHDMGDALLA